MIKNNVIGPSGESYGVGKIADGVSLSCRDSQVKDNVIFDATDGAIVVFSSPGSEVSGNQITASTRVMLGAINLVDFAPWNGDYTGVRVHHNSIIAAGSQLKIGIAQGPACWGDDVTDFNFGAQVYSNSFSGPDISFGLAVAGVKSWTVTDNTVDSSARFRGGQPLVSLHLLALLSFGVVADVIILPPSQSRRATATVSVRPSSRRLRSWIQTRRRRPSVWERRPTAGRRARSSTCSAMSPTPLQQGHPRTRRSSLAGRALLRRRPLLGRRTGRTRATASWTRRPACSSESSSRPSQTRSSTARAGVPRSSTTTPDSRVSPCSLAISLGPILTLLFCFGHPFADGNQ